MIHKAPGGNNGNRLSWAAALEDDRRVAGVAAVDGGCPRKTDDDGDGDDDEEEEEKHGEAATAAATAAKATRRGRCHRPAVAVCPSRRQLMPPRSADNADPDDAARSPRLLFIPYAGLTEKQPDSLWTGSAPAFRGRRAMVNKIWCRKVARSWLQANPEPPHPRTFSEPRCQDYAATWYLAYRSLVLLAWLVIILCSILELGSHNPQGNNHKWLIYLTNWDLVLGATQASLGLACVLRRWKLQQANFEAKNMTTGKLEKFYWFLYTSTCTVAIGVTVSYWAAVHDPKIHQVDVLNVMLHVCNSVLMILDICVTSVALRLRHFWWPLTIAFPYIIFSAIYYAAGGTDKRGLPYIYKVLNWQRPGLAIPVCLGGMLFLVIVHCLLCLVTSLRERLYDRGGSDIVGEKYVRETSTTSTSEQSAQTIKQAQIV